MSVRIVLADDHAIVRRHLRALLEAEQGWEVCAEAENGRQAVRFCDEFRPEVAVLDLSMPVMGGLEATRIIRAVEPTTAVMIASVHDAPAMVEAAINAGARGYILKSEAPDHLVRAVRALLEPNATYFPTRSRVP
jgi:DNA-binding NarL/FixJ family response regulator